MEEKYLTIQELCKFLAVKKDTIYRLIKNNNLPAHKVGKSWRFLSSEVKEWVASGKAEG